MAAGTADCARVVRGGARSWPSRTRIRPRLLRDTAGSGRLDELVAAHCARLRPRDYFGVLAYVERCAAHEASLARLRHAVRDARRVATTVGFGPRFLHSTGQAFKGGPDSGVFLQVTCDDEEDLPVPGHASTFGVVKRAQARGDLAVLAERGGRVLRLHLAGPVGPGCPPSPTSSAARSRSPRQRRTGRPGRSRIAPHGSRPATNGYVPVQRGARASRETSRTPS